MLLPSTPLLSAVSRLAPSLDCIAIPHRFPLEWGGLRVNLKIIYHPTGAPGAAGALSCRYCPRMNPASNRCPIRNSDLERIQSPFILTNFVEGAARSTPATKNSRWGPRCWCSRRLERIASGYTDSDFAIGLRPPDVGSFLVGSLQRFLERKLPIDRCVALSKTDLESIWMSQLSCLGV